MPAKCLNANRLNTALKLVMKHIAGSLSDKVESWNARLISARQVYRRCNVNKARETHRP